jgi:two-component system, chemotaxis family, sensor kinase CheA
MFNFNYGKYRGIIISIALFLLLDASVLLLNFYVSFEISTDAVGINLAGRQRMLSQRMAKSLFVLNGAQDEPAAFTTSLEELVISKNMFDETLHAFIEGGSVAGANKEKVRLNALTSVTGQEKLRQAAEIWKNYKVAIDELAQDIAQQNPNYQQSLISAVTMARLHNLTLLKLMNDLTVHLEQVADSKATRLRIIQTIGISLALLNFIFIMLHFIRQLRSSDAILDRARKETTEILATVNEGLLLIDAQLAIGEQHSAKLKEILGQELIAGSSFAVLLSSIINAKDAETASSFIELLFDPKVKEKLIGDLNPLNLVEVNIAQASGSYLTKYLCFNFARAYHASNISHVLVTIQDITEQVKLERALAESKKSNEEQFEMLTSLLHTHPSLLKEFIGNCYSCFNRINNSLRQPAKSLLALQDKITSIFKEIHNFKGESSALNLTNFENSAHLIEDTLADLRSKKNLNGNDFLRLTVQLETLINYTKQVENLIEKLGQFSIISNTQKGSNKIELSQDISTWSQLDTYVQSLAERNGKQVQLVTSGLQDLTLHKHYQQQLKEICLQLLRNAVVHGIETPLERELSQKSPQGRIDLRIAKISAVELELSVMDDGQGLDYERIRQTALESGQWQSHELESWSNKQLLSLIFNSGFSTATQLTKDAGRGVGMEAVMNRVQEHRGKITVSSRPSHHCRFVLRMPIIAPSEEIIAA